ncbi:MAG: YitT family protein [Butyrivibrio sp.]|uniref:YitT family protein n=1 Tax=Butyrivibrio sp. TaxID=28121 RepID=UPI0025F11677|nr:YitT family protein [Butyrivibrio sp.]MCR5772809.1 YitT family protein [Butyrivibrio sp.]
MSKRKNLSKLIVNYLLITAASFLYGIGTAIFSDPNNIAPGGITGIAIVLNRIVPFGTGTWFMLLNIPILLVGTWKFGWHFICSTLYATGMISVFTNFIAKHGQAFFVHDMVLASVFGGLFAGVAMAIIFQQGATSGGSDIIIKLLRLKYPHIKTGGLLFITDLFVIAFAAIVIKDIPAALYAFITVFINGIALDKVLYGNDEAKLLFIISDRHTTITKRLLKELDLGVTHVYGQGAFSGKDKKVIMCVVRKRISPQAQEIVKEEDPEAFMIITSATEIYGEGYKSYFEEKI